MPLARSDQKHRLWRRQWLFEYKSKLACVYCGYDNPLALDLDHVDRTSKVQAPSVMVTGGYAWDRVLEEIDKCQPVCRNCHNIKSIIEADKLKGCDIEDHIPDNMKHIRK